MFSMFLAPEQNIGLSNSWSQAMQALIIESKEQMRQKQHQKFDIKWVRFEQSELYSLSLSKEMLGGSGLADLRPGQIQLWDRDRSSTETEDERNEERVMHNGYNSSRKWHGGETYFF